MNKIDDIKNEDKASYAGFDADAMYHAWKKKQYEENRDDTQKFIEDDLIPFLVMGVPIIALIIKIIVIYY